jgi:hypothetical protein
VIAALARLGLDYADILTMRADLLCAIKRSNNDLLRSFR